MDVRVVAVSDQGVELRCELGRRELSAGLKKQEQGDEAAGTHRIKDTPIHDMF